MPKIEGSGYRLTAYFQEYRNRRVGQERFDGAPLEFPSRLAGRHPYNPAHLADLSSLRLI